MKKTKLFASMLMAFALVFTACTNVNEPDPDPKPGEKVTIYSENFGTDLTSVEPVTKWPTITSYTLFQKDGKGAAAVTYGSEGGAVSIRGNQPSSAYTGASGANNAMIAAGGGSLLIKNIATCGAKKLSLSFGSIVVGDTLAIQYRVSGTTVWNPVTYKKDKSGWGLVENVEIVLAAGTNTINLKFTAARTQYGTRVDDIKITTDDATTAAIVDTDIPTGGETSTGSGTEASPYNVTAAILNQGGLKWIEGYIVGNVDGQGLSVSTESKFSAPFTINTNILIAASAKETDYSKCMPVQLPSGAIRTGLNLVDHATNLGKKVKLYGSLETYFSAPGIKSASYFELEGGTTGGTKPTETTGAILNETLLTQASFAKFTPVSVIGSQVWIFSAQYGALISGFENNVSYVNEDWFISPALDLSGKTNVKLSFDHARGPAGSINIGVTEGYYTVWVSNNYSTGAPSTATWTEMTGVIHGTSAWGFVSSGELTFPAANLKANARFAFKYKSIDGASATWEVKNVIVK